MSALEYSRFCRDCGTLLNAKTGNCDKCNPAGDDPNVEWSPAWIRKNYPDLKVG